MVGYEEFLFWTFNICSSTFLVDFRPRNMAEAVRYRPCRGSEAHICWYCFDQFRDGECSVLLRSAGSEWSESSHEKVESREWNKVDCKFSEVEVELTRESEAAGAPGETGGDQMVEISVRRRRELQCAEADVVQSLIIHAETLVTVLDELMNRERAIVRLDDRVGYFRRRHDAERHHYTIWVLLADLAYEKRAHSSTWLK